MNVYEGQLDNKSMDVCSKIQYPNKRNRKVKCKEWNKKYHKTIISHMLQESDPPNQGDWYG